ncbi:hypothetical protein [Pseudomonas sp. OST1909]|uniref:hypothetical protein n=1 Tax=Pseudomonas sp. OST1909 TaxID=2777367 RepID=UPI001F5BEE68|nr:hypothetical protein [Pseudomonas sp. OST1909]
MTVKTKAPSMSIIRGLLFTYDIENTDDLEREARIASADVNDEKELTELFDDLTKPEFLIYTTSEQDWFITSIEYFLAASDNFDDAFKKMTTYFSAEIVDQRKFMRVLLRCLQHYKIESDAS